VQGHQRVRGLEVLVAAQVTHGLDVEGLPQRLGVVVADPGQRADRGVQDLLQRLRVVAVDHVAGPAEVCEVLGNHADSIARAR